MFRPSFVITEICVSTRAVSSFAIPAPAHPRARETERSGASKKHESVRAWREKHVHRITTNVDDAGWFSTITQARPRVRLPLAERRLSTGSTRCRPPRASPARRRWTPTSRAARTDRRQRKHDVRRREPRLLRASPPSQPRLRVPADPRRGRASSAASRSRQWTPPPPPRPPASRAASSSRSRPRRWPLRRRRPRGRGDGGHDGGGGGHAEARAALRAALAANVPKPRRPRCFVWCSTTRARGASRRTTGRERVGAVRAGAPGELRA